MPSADGAAGAGAAAAAGAGAAGATVAAVPGQLTQAAGHFNTLQRFVAGGLQRITPAHWAKHAHHWRILHGRYVCKARKPDCPLECSAF